MLKTALLIADACAGAALLALALKFYSILKNNKDETVGEVEPAMNRLFNLITAAVIAVAVLSVALILLPD